MLMVVVYVRRLCEGTSTNRATLSEQSVIRFHRQTVHVAPPCRIFSFSFSFLGMFNTTWNTPALRRSGSFVGSAAGDTNLRFHVLPFKKNLGGVEGTAQTWVISPRRFV
jgi:hypothetical protein